MISNPDYQRFYVHDPDPNFSPERNKWIVEESIRRYEAFRKKKFKKVREGIAERSEAVASYLTSIHGAESKNSVERYFGKRTLAYLRGLEITDRIRAMQSKNKIYVGQEVQDKKIIRV